ncbi:conserved hypothetical protein [Ricinus communis]|uniref:Uncharacterized protein n=1 Tax=Ricinus communis TaxID=3988 RepID=B9TL75_RICCO|nr:conserved hypothetical protein [Ricinus communis]
MPFSVKLNSSSAVPARLRTRALKARGPARSPASSTKLNVVGVNVARSRSKEARPVPL